MRLHLLTSLLAALCADLAAVFTSPDDAAPAAQCHVMACVADCARCYA